MVHWSSLAAVCLAFSFVNGEQEQFRFQKEDSLHHAHRLLEDYPVIDTHNDLPL